jgi:hypothetical protein
MAGKRNQGAKIRVVASVPNLSEVEVGELVYVTSSDRLYVRLINGWKYIATDG